MFPLLRLTRLARDEVLKILTPIELFNLSLCSKNAHQIVKYFVRIIKKYCSITIDFSDELSVDVNRKKQVVHGEWSFSVFPDQKLDDFVDHKYSGKIKDVKFISVTFKNRVETFWKDDVEGFKILVDYLMDLYNQKAEGFLFKTREFSESMDILNWVRRRHNFIEYGEVHLDSIKEKAELNRILENLNFIEKIKIYSLQTEDVDGLENIFDFKELHINSGRWVTVPFILKMRSENLTVSDTNLTSEDVNEILKSWKSGEILRNLKFLSLDLYKEEMGPILMDIELEAPVRTMEENHIVSSTCQIRRSDGVLAGIKIVESRMFERLVVELEIGD